MKYAIYNKTEKRFVKTKDWDLLVFKYPVQALKYIERHFGNSPNFEIFELKKLETKDLNTTETL